MSFIQAEDGSWISMSYIKSFSTEGNEKEGYYMYATLSDDCQKLLSKKYPSYEHCQADLRIFVLNLR